nr:transmembrane protein 241-like isoform X2 [Cherax quadricarinatus]
MTPTKQPIDFLIYLILFGSTIFVNKYVLSVLNFTYPTIYQGWQTLVGGILLRVLLSNKCLSISATDLDKPGFISLLPSFLFFAAGIVASSKALCNLSVPVFLCLQNTLGAMLYLMEIAPSFRSGSGPLPLLASLVTIGTAVAAVLADIDMTFSDSAYFWMLVYLACVAVQTLHSKIADARYTDIDRLYFSYVFSVVVLAPASLYLEEAFEVLHFPHAMRYDFYAGCLLSGVLGLFLNLSFMKGTTGENVYIQWTLEFRQHQLSYCKKISWQPSTSTASCEQPSTSTASCEQPSTSTASCEQPSTSTASCEQPSTSTANLQ